jgi:predicted dehydrogenase
VPHGLTTLSAALALPGVDVVSVTTPPHSHAGVVLEAIAAGKHVVCEKPFARDAAEARRMFEAAEEAGVVHLLGTEFRFATGQAVATRAVRGGAIGEPRLATFVLQVPMLADPSSEVPAWWSDASQGGGWLGAYGWHVIDQVQHTLGTITGVSASLGLVSEHRWSVEDTYSVHFRTRSGVDGIMQSSAGTWGPPLACSRIAGTRGTLWTEGDNVYWQTDRANGNSRCPKSCATQRRCHPTSKPSPPTTRRTRWASTSRRSRSCSACCSRASPTAVPFPTRLPQPSPTASQCRP